MLALDPPDRRRHARRHRGHRRLRPAPRPLRRRARSRGRHARRALGRHDREERRQGDQERGGLRPREAVHRLVRHARGDPRGVGPPAPARRPRAPPRSAARRRPRRARPRRSSPCRARRSSTAASTSAGRAARGALLVRFARRGPARRRRSPPSGCCASAGARDRDRRGRRRAVGGAARAPALGPPAERSCASRRSRRGCPTLIRATEDAGGSLVGRAALGLSWVRLPEPSGRPDRVAARALPALPVRRARPARASLDVDPWGPVDPARSR